MAIGESDSYRGNIAGWLDSPKGPLELSGREFSVGRVSKAAHLSLTTLSCQVQVESRGRVGLNQQV